MSSRRILLVIDSRTERTQQEMAKLRAPDGPFVKLLTKGWSVGSGRDSDVQIVDISHSVPDDLKELVAKIDPARLPLPVFIDNGEIARSFQQGCTTPLDEWTFGWLRTGNDERPIEPPPEPVQVATTGHYPLRGNHWSVEGNWNPTREYVIHHLRSTHGQQLQTGWQIEEWSLEELKSVHDDLHDREQGFRGRYAGTSTSSSSSSRSGSVSGIQKPGKASR
ncbi:MAG: hypothetical protein KDA58_07730 [Planctomycetaceae bacterium]|nr:hypothetical protein [Planctomycetaceae bacterium]